MQRHRRGCGCISVPGAGLGAGGRLRKRDRLRPRGRPGEWERPGPKHDSSEPGGRRAADPADTRRALRARFGGGGWKRGLGLGGFLERERLSQMEGGVAV